MYVVGLGLHFIILKFTYFKQTGMGSQTVSPILHLGLQGSGRARAPCTCKGPLHVAGKLGRPLPIACWGDMEVDMVFTGRRFTWKFLIFHHWRWWTPCRQSPCGRRHVISSGRTFHRRSAGQSVVKGMLPVGFARKCFLLPFSEERKLGKNIQIFCENLQNFSFPDNFRYHENFSNFFYDNFVFRKVFTKIFVFQNIQYSQKFLSYRIFLLNIFTKMKVRKKNNFQNNKKSQLPISNQQKSIQI